MGFKPTAEQKKIFHFIEKRKENLIIDAKAGCGKCLGIDTPILMYDGTIKKVQHIKKNDLLMGDDGTPRKVFNTNIGYGDLYEIIPQKGESWICNDIHIMSLYHENKKKIIDIPLNEIIYTQYPNGNYRKLRLQRSNSVEFKEKKVNLDPYFLGLWLGNGKKGKGNPTIFVNHKEKPIINYLKSLKFKDITIKINDYRNNGLLNIDFTTPNFIGKKGRNFIRNEFKKCLLHNDICIPKNYLLNNKKNRLKLLAGIIDSDGYQYSKCYEIITKYNTLKNDILFLCRSLGFAAYANISTKEIKSRKFSGKYWRITISGSFENLPVLLKRKKCKSRQLNKSVLRTGFKKKYLGKGNYYGFTLDGNGRFLLGDFTITHNTSTIVAALKLIPKDKDITFLAFNKHIKEELKNRLPEHVRCYTFHGLGMSAIKRKYGDKIQFNEFKVDQLLKKKSKNWKLNLEMPIFHDQVEYLASIKKMVNMCRQTLTMDKKWLPYIADKYDIKLNNDKDYKRVFSVLEILTNDRKTFDFIDMVYLAATDKKIWLFPQDYVLVDEVQDLNRAQQILISKILKRDKITNKITGRLIGVGDENQCQPEGTKILMYDGTEKNIEELKIGDAVVSYDKSQSSRIRGYYGHLKRDLLKMKKYAPVVENISKRIFNDKLIVIKSNNKITKYTPNHRCFVRFKKYSLNKYCLYLMEKNGFFRIGINPLWSKDNRNSITFRARQERCEKFWLLNIYDNKYDAYFDEQFFSIKYGIPQLRFYDNKTGNITQNDIDKNELYYLAVDLLKNFNKNINFPFWEKGEKFYISKNHIFEIKACNIFSNHMEMIHFDCTNLQIRTHGKNKPKNYHYKPTYHTIEELIYEKYNGYVYSLKIKKWENYVADNIITHNSIYGFSGVSEKSFDWFRKFPNVKILPLTHTFRCPKKVVELAQKIVPDIKATENAIEGEIRYDGDVLNEPTDGDFVLCRTTTPLIKLFFHYLLEGKKSGIKGSDVGLSILEMTNDHKSLAQLLAYWQNELEKYRVNLRKKGILNYEDDSGYVILEDKVLVLQFLGKLCKDIFDLREKINQIFRDDVEGIILSTIHKAKGLEADRVFIARPDKLPLPVSKAWQYKQEMNLKYVAITRAKKELIFDNDWKDDS